MAKVRCRCAIHWSVAAFAVAVVWLLLAPTTVHAGDTIRVDAATGSDVTGDGSLAKPYGSVTKAVSVATSGDVVRVAPGTYFPLTGEVLPIDVPTGVRISGTGQQGETIVAGNGTSAVFRIEDGNNDTILEGLTIQNSGGVFGSAVYILNGTAPGYGPVVQRCLFRLNDTDNYGGAITALHVSGPAFKPVIRYNFFVSNHADGDGGAIYQGGGTLELVQNTFDNNSADDGGAVYAYQCDGRIVRCQFGNGFAATGRNGGAIALEDCTDVTVRRSVMAYNGAGNGGALYTDGSSVSVKACVLSTNGAQNGGGAYIDGGTVTFDGCSVYYNDATSMNDGIMAVGGAAASVTNSIVYNFAGDDVNGVTATYSCFGEDVTGTGNINAYFGPVGDAPFYTLTGTSPCIDTGDPAVTSGTDYDGTTRYQDGDGAGGPRTDMGAYEYGVVTGRISGSDRYSTAAAMATGRFVASDEAVLVTGLDFPDALSASGLAGVYRAPILLTRPDGLPNVVRQALRDLETRQVFIVGGTGVVHETVATQLRGMGIDVVRLAGSNRYETCRAVADHIESKGHMGTCFVARGDDYPDALALGPVAYARRGAIFLVETDDIPATIKTAIASHGYSNAWVAGGEGAVSETVVAELRGVFGDGYVTRLNGSDRYSTAQSIATFAVGADWLYPRYFGVANGLGFADALAGGPVCAYNAGPLVLTKPGELPQTLRAMFANYHSQPRHAIAFGGTGVVSDAVLEDIAEVTPP